MKSEVIEQGLVWLTQEVAYRCRTKDRVPLAVIAGEPVGPDGAPTDRLHLIVPDTWTNEHVRELLRQLSQVAAAMEVES